MAKNLKLSAPDMEPVLWILMRTDLASMNPGKAVAQGAHAANLAVLNAQAIAKIMPAVDELLVDWDEGRGFGTTITLAVDGDTLLDRIDFAREELELVAGVVHDPEYPLRDGRVTHLIPLDTCGYVFARRAWIADLLDDLSLMP